MLIEPKRRYRVGEVARLSGLHENTVRKLADEGVVPCNRDYNNHRVFTPEGIERLKELAGIPKQKPTTVGAERVGMNA